MPAAPAIPMQEYSSLRNTFSMSRCEIMFPAVARRSPAMTTPPLNAAATIVVPCGTSLDSSPGNVKPRAPGSSSGAAQVRNSLNDDVPAAMNAVAIGLALESANAILSSVRHEPVRDNQCAATSARIRYAPDPTATSPQAAYPVAVGKPQAAGHSPPF